MNFETMGSIPVSGQNLQHVVALLGVGLLFALANRPKLQLLAHLKKIRSLSSFCSLALLPEDQDLKES